MSKEKLEQERENFEICIKACGYYGPLIWDEALQTYASSHESALFAGFRLGVRFMEATGNGN